MEWFGHEHSGLPPGGGQDNRHPVGLHSSFGLWESLPHFQLALWLPLVLRGSLNVRIRRVGFGCGLGHSSIAYRAPRPKAALPDDDFVSGPGSGEVQRQEDLGADSRKQVRKMAVGLNRLPGGGILCG